MKVRPTYYSCVRLAVLLLTLSAVSFAQFRDRVSSVSGQLVGSFGNGYRVELWDGVGSQCIATSMPNSNGDFYFNNIAQGDYRVKVTSPSGDVIRQDTVSVSGSSQRLSLSLPDMSAAPASPAPANSGTGTVSYYRLKHKVPKEATKEFNSAMAATQKGQKEEAIGHLEKALKIDPLFMEAHNNLAARYVEKADIKKAAYHFQRASELDPGNAVVFSNYSTVLLAMGQAEEALAAARTSVRLNPTSVRGRYALGMALATTGEDFAEALHNLELAEGEFPRAAMFRADVLGRQGKTDEALKVVEAYKPNANAYDRELIDSWLARVLTTHAEAR
jgi:tetratricopeptide (TPR) repeat protein